MTTEANRKRHQAYVNLDWRILAQTVVAEMEAEGHVVVRQASSSGSAACSNAFLYPAISGIAAVLRRAWGKLRIFRCRPFTAD